MHVNWIELTKDEGHSWPARQLLGAQVVTAIMENVGPVNSGFHTQKNFSENYLQFGHVPS